MIKESVFLLVIVSLYNVYGASPLDGSTCTIQLTSGTSVEIKLGSFLSVDLECTVTNTGVTTAKPFYIFLSAPQSVDANLLSNCGAASCIVPALNVSSINSLVGLTDVPLAQYDYSQDGVISVLSGTVNAASSTQVSSSSMNLFVGSLFVASETGLDVTVSVRDPDDDVTNAIGSSVLSVDIQPLPSLMSLTFDKNTQYLPVGEKDGISFTISSVPTSSLDNPLLVHIFSNYLVTFYQMSVDGVSVLGDLVQSTVSAPSTINSPCISDICQSSSALIYQYTLDLSTSCCSESTSHVFDFDYHLSETPNGIDNFYVSFYALLADSDIPLFIGIKNAQTFATNPGIVITKTVNMATLDPKPEVYQVTIDVDNSSPVDIYQLVVADDVSDMKVIDNANKVAPGSGWDTYDANLTASYDTPLSTSTNSLIYTYDVSLFGTGASFPKDKQWKQTRAFFYLVSAAEAVNGYLGKKFQVSPECPACFVANEVETVQTEDKYDFVVVGVLLCFIFGVVVMLLLLCLLINFFGFSGVITVSPIGDEETPEEKERRLRKEMRDKRRKEREKRHEARNKRNQNVSKSAVLMKKMKLYLIGSKKAYASAMDSLSLKSDFTVSEYENRNLIHVATVDDAIKTDKELSCMDIAQSIEIDKEVEQERVNMMLLAIKSIILKNNESNSAKGLDSSFAQRLVKKIELDIADMKRKSCEQNKIESEKNNRLMKRRHERLIMKLRLKQLNERKPLMKILKNEPKAERHSVLELLDKQHRRELDELAHVLQLERFESSESFRRTKAVEQRLKVKEIINESLLSQKYSSNQASSLPGSPSRSSVSSSSDFEQDFQLDSMRQEFVNMVNSIETALDAYCAEIKCIMDEKLSWRRNFMSEKELINERQRQALNLVTEQIRRFLETQISLGRIDEDDRNGWMGRMRDDIVAIKNAMHEEKESQLLKLQNTKQAQLVELKNASRSSLNDSLKTYDKKKFDLVVNGGQMSNKSFVEDRVRLLLESNRKLLNSEMSFDEECGNEYIDLVGVVFLRVYAALEITTKSYVADLADTGCDEEEGTALIEQFERDKERMKLNLEQQLDQMDHLYQKKLQKDRKKWKERRLEEKMEQETLRQHEEKLIKALTESRFMVSQEDVSQSQKLAAERERLLTSVESSVTMQKLRSQRKLEQLLHSRKEKRLEKTLKQQKEEIDAREMRKRYETEDMSDGDFVRALISERIARCVTSVPKKRMTEMLYEIEEQLIRERLENVKEQEEKMASFMAAQQLQKSRELARIEEQHARLVKLKMCLLAEVGHKESLNKPASINNDTKLSTADSSDSTDAQTVAGQLLIHFQQGLERMDVKLENEKARQTNVMQHKMAQRRKSVSAATAVGDGADDKVKKLTQMEEFESELEKDRLNENAYMDLHKAKWEALQQQEEEMVKSLVGVSGLSASELLSILMMIFPERSDKELQRMAYKLSSSKSLDATDDDATSSSTKIDITNQIIPAKSANGGQLETLVKLELLNSTETSTDNYDPVLPSRSSSNMKSR